MEKFLSLMAAFQKGLSRFILLSLVTTVHSWHAQFSMMLRLYQGANTDIKIMNRGSSEIGSTASILKVCDEIDLNSGRLIMNSRKDHELKFLRPDYLSCKELQFVIKFNSKK